jgi:hypothetical protein
MPHPIPPVLPPTCPALQYGSNQVFEQLFQAHEQKLSRRGERQYYEQGWVDPRVHRYACPAERHLDVSFNLTPEVRRRGRRLGG